MNESEISSESGVSAAGSEPVIETQLPDKWQKTHPLSEFHNRILTGAVIVALIILAVALFYGFSDMFRTQGF